MKHTEALATVELGGDERDVLVRAYVERCRLYGGSMGYRLDGDAEAFVDGRWVDLDALDASRADREIIEQAICDAAELDAPDEPVGAYSRTSATGFR